MLGTPAQDAFVTANRSAIITTLRKDGSPTTSLVTFYRDGDDLLFSTSATRLKAKTLKNDPRLTFCVISQTSSSYVTIEGVGIVETNDIVAKHIALNRAMRGGEFTPPDGYEQRLKDEGRVIIRVKPRRVSGVVRS
jgi:PPOX class probable F420-dependent enzyme